ncbi:MAG TPA: M36 family metallopeptidase [Candidatus Polarisedimenticolia bacterium]|jgi:hypothetical protein
MRYEWGYRQFAEGTISTSLIAVIFMLGATATQAAPQKFLTNPVSGDPVDIAQGYVRNNRAALGLTEADLRDIVIRDRYRTEHNGVTHIYIAQTLRGIEVFNGLINVNVTKDGRIANLGNRFVADLARSAGTRAPALTAEEAIGRVAARLGLRVTAPLEEESGPTGAARAVVYRAGALSIHPIRVKLVYLPYRPGQVRLTWEVDISPNDQHMWLMHVDAESGEVLAQRDMIQRDTYKVYPWPVESPSHVSGGLPLPPGDGRTVVNQTAANPTASPFGWHDLNGVMGADTVDTTGNNVFAQTDLDNNDAFAPGVENRPVSPFRDFQPPCDLTQQPAAYRDAAVTNLFYWNNILHDLHYLYGFTEAAGNFQFNNYGKGGLGGDAVDADAQDGSGTNNANFGTRIDGLTPRMQMFVWTAQTALTIFPPSSAAGEYPAGSAGFGARLDQTGLSGSIVLVDDGTGATSDACEPISQDLTGKIALIDRGTCEFGLKVKNAEDAGAAAAVVANNAGEQIIGMAPGATGGQVTIPSVFVAQSTGERVKTSLAGDPGPISANMRTVGVDRDSDLDNGVIAHEYGHGVSTRLTGGPNTVTCLSGDQQAGEGWSDWWALALTARAGATGAEPRGIATYLTFEDPATGLGIRPFPYSTDMSINPQTYGDLTTGTLTVPHGVGTVWATAIWDVYWNLVNGVPALGLPGEGFRQNIYDMGAPLAGNQVALQLVMDGLKLQPCNPTFLDGRDAILLADDIKYGGAHSCHIWAAFARRGMGVNAQDGGGTLTVTEDFTLPFQCTGGACQDAPTFAGAGSVTAASSGTCQLTVSWSAATDNCDSGRLTYSIFRSTDGAFTPDATSQVASGLTGTSYVDRDVTGGVEYHYIVRATDGLGNTELNTVRRSETPIGSLSPGGTLADDAGDTTTRKFAPAQVPNNTWAVRSTGGDSGPMVYATTAAGNYPDDSCLSLESDTIYLGANPTLSFTSKYDIEATWDGGIVEVATSAGGFSNWTKLDTINYPFLMASTQGDPACANAGFKDGELVFGATSAGLYLPFSGSLAKYASQAVRIRFLFASDGATNDLGWFIDNISIDDVQQPGACTTQPNRPPDAVDDAAVTEENTPVSVDVLANDSDPDGDAITLASLTQPAHGSALNNGDGTVTYTPDNGFTGLDTFTYTAEDGLGGSDTATVTVQVNEDMGPGCREIDDADTAVDYRAGWHRRDDARASNGGYHRRMGGNNSGNSSTPIARVVFDGEEVTYFYVKSDKGGTADIYLDGALRESLSYLDTSAGSGGHTFGHSRTYTGLGAGQHELRIEHRSGAVYVDGFGFACEGTDGADATAPAFNSATETDMASSAEGPVIVRTVEIGPDDVAISVVVEGSLVPLTVNLIDPSGNLIATGQALISGLTASGLDSGVTSWGVYQIQVLNPGNAFTRLEMSTARQVRTGNPIPLSTTPPLEGRGVEIEGTVPVSIP